MQLQSLISILVLVLLSIAVGTHQHSLKMLPNKNPSNSYPELDRDLFEGDIEGPDPTIRSKNGRLDRTMRWEDYIIPYVIDGKFDKKEQGKIMGAIAEYHKKTCLKFVPLRLVSQKHDKNYVRFIKEKNVCSSPVGRQRKPVGGVQYIKLSPGCVGSHGIIVHEIMHAIGFYHEQSRTDRDEYVDIIWQNIPEDKKFNFKKYGVEHIDDLGIKYDYYSIMHYSEIAFSKNKKPTMVTLKPMKGKLGLIYRSGLSRSDANKINIYYNCIGFRNNRPTTQRPTTKRTTTKRRTTLRFTFTPNRKGY